jgi:hypothetical protein
LVLIAEFLWKAKQTSNLSLSKLKLIICRILKDLFKKRFLNVFKNGEKHYHFQYIKNNQLIRKSFKKRQNSRRNKRNSYKQRQNYLKANNVKHYV